MNSVDDDRLQIKHIILTEILNQLKQKLPDACIEVTNSNSLFVRGICVTDRNSETIITVCNDTINVYHDAYVAFAVNAIRFSLHDQECIRKTIEWIEFKLCQTNGEVNYIGDSECTS